MGDLTPHFDRSEFACKCGCGFNQPHPELAARLEGARILLGVDLHVTSGCRCLLQNNQVNGSRNSLHLLGKAVDLSCNTPPFRHTLLTVALQAGFTRIGIGPTFLHLDIGTEGVSPKAIWTY